MLLKKVKALPGVGHAGQALRQVQPRALRFERARSAPPRHRAGAALVHGHIAWDRAPGFAFAAGRGGIGLERADGDGGGLAGALPRRLRSFPRVGRSRR